MQTEPPKADPPKRKRRWFQFSLRSLFVFTLICAIPCTWLGRKIERKHTEREAVEAIVKLGGDVQYVSEQSGAKPAAPSWLRDLLGENFFDDVELVDLSFMQVKDDGFEKLKALTELKRLLLTATGANDAALQNLRALTRLQELRLGETNVTDAGLDNLKRLTQLQRLNLDRTKIIGSGLVGLKGLAELHSLDLEQASVTDAGLVSLKWV
jgi:hypothetical protein